MRILCVLNRKYFLDNIACFTIVNGIPITIVSEYVPK